MTKTNIGIAGVCIIAGLGASLIIHHQAQASLREQQAGLHQQSSELAELEAESRALASPARELGRPNVRENLIKLRRDVGLLRSQTNALSTFQQENRRLHDAQKTPLQIVEESREASILKMNYTKEWMLAFHNFAADHEGQFPSSFDQARSLLPNTAAAETNLTTEQFEIVYHGAQNAISNPAMVMVIRENQAWSDYTGQSWCRAYGFADGHSEIHKIRGVSNAAEAARADAEPDAWEKQHMASPPPP
jgi:hypothetical protein